MKLNKNILLSVVASGLFVMAANANALCVQRNNTIGLFGVDSSYGRVLASLSGHNNSCGCNNVRFFDSNSDLDKIYTLLLTAKTSNAKVRIDFINQGDCNSGIRAYIE